MPGPAAGVRPLTGEVSVTLHRRLPLIAALLAAATGGRAEPPAAPDPPAVGRLIRQLGSDDFDEREAASKALR